MIKSWNLYLFRSSLHNQTIAGFTHNSIFSQFKTLSRKQSLTACNHLNIWFSKAQSCSKRQRASKKKTINQPIQQSLKTRTRPQSSFNHHISWSNRNQLLDRLRLAFKATSRDVFLGIKLSTSGTTEEFQLKRVRFCTTWLGSTRDARAIDRMQDFAWSLPGHLKHCTKFHQSGIKSFFPVNSWRDR